MEKKQRFGILRVFGILILFASGNSLAATTLEKANAFLASMDAITIPLSQECNRLAWVAEQKGKGENFERVEECLKQLERRLC